MKTIVHNLDTHPVFALLISIFGIGSGYWLHEAHPILLNASSSEFVDYVVKFFQCFAFAGGGLAGFVSFHGWYIKRKDKKKGRRG